MSSPEPIPSQREHLRAHRRGPEAGSLASVVTANDLKRAIVDYAFARQDERATIGQIAAELDLSAWLLGKWLRHARLRLEKGKIPFEPGEPLPIRGGSSPPTSPPSRARGWRPPS